MKRRLKPEEKLLIETMLEGHSKADHLLPSLSKYFVEEMDDGGMRGLKFRSDRNDRCLGQVLANMEFVDDDGVSVFVTLNLDNYGDLYELDIWKTDFSPLKRFPGES